MKILNIFLSILILLLAVASAVFSYFLYEKRMQLVKGWEKMAQAVNSSAANLDQGSGTTVAKSLTVESLAHDKYEELDGKLPKLKKHAAEIIAERDTMAKALREIAETSEVDNLQSLEKFQELATYKSNADAVVEKVNGNAKQQMDILEQLCKTAGNLNLDITVSALKGSNYSSEIDKFNNKVNAVKERIDNSDKEFRSIYSIAGEAAVLDFSDNTYQNAISKVTSAVRGLRKKYDDSQSSLRSADTQVVNLQNTIKEKDGRIEDLNDDINKKTLEIKRLRIIITGGKEAGDVIGSLWENGSMEARRAVQGKIIKVDRKYGFVVVDLGTNTKVKQKIGTKTNYANPMIPVNCKMIVARDIESSNGEYIGEIELVKVHEDCSIANVISTAKGKGAAVGDTVFFSSAQIDAMGKK